MNLGILEVYDLLLFTINPARKDEKEELPGLEDEFHPTEVTGGVVEASIFPDNWLTVG